MKEYIAKKVNSKLTIDDARWNGAEEVKLDYVWIGYKESPYNTFAKLVHSDEGITAKLTTDEWPLRITATKNNDSVCIDSCMEFFFIPNTVDKEYFNFEMNPAAILLSCIGEGRGERRRIDISGKGVEITTSVKGGEGWSVMAYIPYSFLLEHYSCVEKEMRANFYKCGNDTVIPHYSTWNPIETPKPDYHRPEYFGKIILSDEEI